MSSSAEHIQAGFGFAHGAPDDERLRAHDADFTPPGCVRQGLVWVRDHLAPPTVRALDPSAGPGVFGQQIRAVWEGAMDSVGVELRAEEAPWCEKNYDQVHIGLPFHDVQLEPGLFDLVATNPPFTLFAEFLEQGWEILSDRGVLMFLGLSTWGQSAEGARLFERLPPTVQLRVTGRIAFRGPGTNPKTKKPWGTDQRDYSWWIWEKEPRLQLHSGWQCLNLPTLPTSLRSWRNRPGTVEVLGPCPGAQSPC